MPIAWNFESTDFADYTDCMKQLKGDAKSARVSFPAACCDKTNFTFIDTPRLAAGRFIPDRLSSRDSHRSIVVLQNSLTLKNSIDNLTVSIQE